MAYVKFYSDSEEFLMGIRTGAEWANDSSISFSSDEDVIKSDNDKYEFMIVAHDGDADEDSCQYYDGGSLDYRDIVS